MEDRNRKERVLGTEQDSPGWKIYGLLPFFLCALGIYLLLSTVGSKVSEKEFLESSTTERVLGQVVEIDVERVSAGPTLHLGKPVVERVGAHNGISTRIVRSGTSLNKEGLRDLRFLSIVEFVALDGETHTFEGGWRTGGAAHVPGDQVEVLYNRNNPKQAILSEKIHDGSTLRVVFGLILLPLALCLFYLNRKRKLKKQKLFQEGVVVSAVIRKVVVDEKISANDEHPIRIVANWSDGGSRVSREFTSDPVFTEYDASLINETVEVVMVPNDPDAYCVDTTFLDMRRSA